MWEILIYSHTHIRDLLDEVNPEEMMKAKYPDPYYWGAFICQGDPSALL